MAFTLTDISQSYELSSQGTLKIGTVKLGGFKSGTLSFSSTSTDNSTRDDQGWTKNAKGKRSSQLQVTYNKMTSDECQIGLRAYMLHADFDKKGVAVEYRTEDNETAPGDGFAGTFTLADYSESTPDEQSGAIECSITLDNWGPITSDTGA